MIFEASEELIDSEDDGSMDRGLFRRRVQVTVESCWQDGMTLEGLVQAARRKLNAPTG